MLTSRKVKTKFKLPIGRYIKMEKDNNSFDWILISFELLILIAGLSIHIVWISDAYHKLQSPFIPQYVVLEILKPHLIHCGYFIIAFIISIIAKLNIIAE